MILVIDNYDSFVHNLARYIELAGWGTKIVRNNAITIEEIETLKPAAIVLSPGPKTPQEAGICIDVIQHFGATTPILGVCLGHQAIGEAYGSETHRHDPVHGKSTAIDHDGSGLFIGMHSPMHVGRYHSLVTQDKNPQLEITAQCKQGIPMAIAHKEHPVYGVQFHPESILTPQGMALIRNFSDIIHDFYANQDKAA